VAGGGLAVGAGDDDGAAGQLDGEVGEQLGIDALGDESGQGGPTTTAERARRGAGGARGGGG
jgi:hypothetical protein